MSNDPDTEFSIPYFEITYVLFFSRNNVFFINPVDLTEYPHLVRKVKVWWLLNLSVSRHPVEITKKWSFPITENRMASKLHGLWTLLTKRENKGNIFSAFYHKNTFFEMHTLTCVLLRIGTSNLKLDLCREKNVPKCGSAVRRIPCTTCQKYRVSFLCSVHLVFWIWPERILTKCG